MERPSRMGLVAAMAVAAFSMFGTQARAQTCNTPPTAGGIVGFVWYDENADGIRNPDESDNGLGGVQLQLVDTNGTVRATTTSSTGVGSILGGYQFFPVCAGTYDVRVVESSLPTGFVPTLEGATPDTSRDSSTSPVSVTLDYDPSSNTVRKAVGIDFGFRTGCTASLGDFVWDDRDQDGVQDAGEPGLANVSVRLMLGGALQASTTTNGNGAYSFAGLCPGTFTVELDAPAGMTASPTMGTPDTSLDSDSSGVTVALAAGQHDPTIDFGYFTPCTGEIGDFVWHDANRNGVQDAGEDGIANVTVQLVDASGTVIRSEVTGPHGGYMFGSLCPATYGVQVKADTLPDGVTASPTGVGGDAAADSNDQPATVVLSTYSSSDHTIDFGYNTPCSGTLGDLVWHDANANGVQDAGEIGLAGVAVTLLRAEGGTVAVDTTDAEGFYGFAGMCAGDYILEVNPGTLPGGGGWTASPANAGSNDALDSDGIDQRASVSLPSDFGTNLTIDFGYDRETAIQIVKRTNGTNNDEAPGPSVTPGSTVTWTYAVTSTGSTEAIADVAVVDDNGTESTADDITPTYVSGDDGDGLLEVGETWLYTATGAAIRGQYENWATVTGTGQYSGTPVTARDPDHYFGGTPVGPTLKIVKVGNGPVSLGGQATFTITVTNLGPGTASGVKVTDVLPAGLAWTESSLCTIAAGVMTCQIGTMTEGQVFTVVLRATLATSAFDARCITVQHHDGDRCDHEKGGRGHRRGDRCEHELATRHHRGDGCDHDKGRWGHRAGDGCEHDRRTSPVECRVVNTATVTGTDLGSWSSTAYIALQPASHHDGDRCDHELRRGSHRDGDRCDHDNASRYRRW